MIHSEEDLLKYSVMSITLIKETDMKPILSIHYMDDTYERILVTKSNVKEMYKELDDLAEKHILKRYKKQQVLLRKAKLERILNEQGGEDSK